MLENQGNPSEDLKGKPFPCPVCGMALPIAISQKQKPYCVCNTCGLQLFFRGKAGIARLKRLLENKEPMAEEIPGAALAVSLYNRLERLREQREELVKKQGIIFRDENLDNAIGAIDGEIRQVESELEKTKQRTEKRK